MSLTYADRFTEAVLLPMADNYFQATIDGELDVLDVVGTRSVIFVGNHAGASLSWDNIIFDALLWRAARRAGRPIKLQRLVYPNLYHDRVSAPYLLPDWWKSMQCHECTIENFDQLCAEKAAIFVSPEGVTGLAKGHHRAGELMRFSSSFVHMAKKHDALVVPVTMANSAYLNPFTRTFDRLNRFVERVLGLPFLPLGPLLVMILLPRFFIGAMPVRLKYRVHAPIRFAGRGADDIELNRRQAEQLRVYMERELARDSDPASVAMPLVQALKDRAARPGANPFHHYRDFWEHHLRRGLTRRERFMFSVPIVGYRLINRRIERGSLECAV